MAAAGFLLKSVSTWPYEWRPITDDKIKNQCVPVASLNKTNFNFNFLSTKVKYLQDGQKCPGKQNDIRINVWNDSLIKLVLMLTYISEKLSN